LRTSAKTSAPSAFKNGYLRCTSEVLTHTLNCWAIIHSSALRTDNYFSGKASSTFRLLIARKSVPPRERLGSNPQLVMLESLIPGTQVCLRRHKLKLEL
jgi:hypothetical protein